MTDAISRLGVVVEEKGGILKIDYNTLRLMEPNDDQNTTDDHLSNMDEIDFASLISGS